ncbi:MAG: MFS transporter [Candidatus Limivicinus sp.]
MINSHSNLRRPPLVPGTGLKIALCFFLMLCAVSTTLLYSTVEKICSSCGGSRGGEGYYLSVYALGLIAGNLLSSSLSDRLGTRKLLIFSLITMGLGMLLTAAAGTQVFAFLSLIIMGMGFSASNALINASLTDISAGNAAKWVNISQIFFCVGAMFSPVASASLCSRAGLSHNTLFLTVGLISAAAAGICSLWDFGPAAAAQDTGKAVKSPLSMLKNAGFLIVCLQIFLYLCCETVESSYLRFYFLERGCPSTLAAFSSTLFWAGVVAGRFIGTCLGGKEAQSLRIFPLIFVAGVAMLLFSGEIWPGLAASALIGLGCGPLFPLLLLRGSRSFPDRSGTAFSIMVLFANLGFFVSPVALVTRVGNLRVSMLICAALAVVIIILSFFPFRRARG